MERSTCSEAVINNNFYDQLNEKWYEADDHPVALLRAENKKRVPWVAEEISKEYTSASVLDIGCGAGFLTNGLSAKGHHVTGIDLSLTSLEVAKKHDSKNAVKYLQANAYQLPFEDASFDVVTAMDVLEHVDNPQRLIQEARRVLKPNGLFFFHTFNRNWLSYLIVIKGVEWFVKNTPANMHVYPLFIKPKELKGMLEREGLSIFKLHGFMPKVNVSFFKMLLQRKVPKDFEFTFTSKPIIGYCGIAKL